MMRPVGPEIIQLAKRIYPNGPAQIEITADEQTRKFYLLSVGATPPLEIALGDNLDELVAFTWEHGWPIMLG